MKNPSPLLLDTPLIDWITATSHEKEFLSYWDRRLSEVGEVRKKDMRTLQYVGNLYDVSGGTAFIGAAYQDGLMHFMLRLSGYAAEDLKGAVLSGIRQGFVKLTRVDIQATVEVTDNWSQWDLLTRLKSIGRTVGWVESKISGKGYETVYVGSRSSDRMVRVYIKQAENPRLLRLEVEYKGDRARIVGTGLSRDQLPGTYLKHELEKTAKDDGLSVIFSRSLETFTRFSPKIVPNTSYARREAWLLTQVLPAFMKHINEHEGSDKVLLAFGDAINEAVKRL